MNEKRQLEEKIKFFDNAQTAVNSGKFPGPSCIHIAALLNLLKGERDAAQAEFEGKFSAPEFGKKPEPVGAA